MKKIVTITPHSAKQFFRDIQYVKECKVDMIRINLTKYEDIESLLTHIELINEMYYTFEDLEIMIDIPYPKLKPRIYIKGHENKVKKGDKYEFYFSEIKMCKEVRNYFKINQIAFANKIKNNGIIYYADGQGAFVLEEKISDNCIIVKACNDFIMYSTKSLSFGIYKGIEELCLKAIRKLHFGKEILIALSFVESSEDLKKFKCAGYKVISKIESEEGVKNLLEILESSHGIMIARGDLGLYADYSKLFKYQEYIVKQCKDNNKECYIATDILDTLEKRFLPSRADLIDLYHIAQMQVEGVVLNYRQIKNRSLERAIEIINDTCSKEEE